MPQKYRLLSLIVICFTLLFFTDDKRFTV
ncbi:hypothetical protein DMI62_00590 [Escherichia coli]|nr:hypothetical protein [Escherichia coli]